MSLTDCHSAQKHCYSFLQLSQNRYCKVRNNKLIRLDPHNPINYMLTVLYVFYPLAYLINYITNCTHYTDSIRW